MGKLDGRVAIVTGAAHGQGAVEARLLADEGAKVVVADIQDELGEKVVATIGEAAVFAHLDVSSSANWGQVVSDTVSRWGKVDVLVNNAGIFPGGSIEDMDEELFMKVVRTNQLGSWLGMKTVVGPMRDAGGGSIVNICSVAGMTAMAGLSAYVGSKHALRGISKTAANEFGQYGIRVNAIFPGAIVGDDLPPGVDRSMIDGMLANLPIPRVGSPVEIAKIVLFLASDDSAYCTGAEIVADGGSLTQSPLPTPGRST